MKITHALFGSLSFIAAVSAQGVTLEQLAKRLEQLESKVEKYESQYGPLQESSSSAPAPLSNAIPMPTPVSRQVVTQATGDDIDASYLAPSTGGAGQYLLPIGILNEVHEPDTFYGVERNNVEVNIIPTTWWEGGVMVSKNFESGLGFDVAVHSALAVTTDLSSSNAFRIRSGRQKVAEADASDYAASFRARYNGIPGLSLTAFANYQNDIAPDNTEDNSALLLGGSAVYQNGGFGLRALIAHWDIQGQSFEDNDADSQWGAYIEPSYRWSFGDQAVGVFGRYSHYEFARGAGNSRGGEFDEFTVGVNYWPIANVVLKADYTLIEQDGEEDNETFNFGIGYSF